MNCRGSGKAGQEGIAAPTHLHLNARAFSGGSAKLAREYELEILSLPFAEQRYPPAPLARKQCQVYRESLEATDYRGLLDSVGFRFTAAQATRNLEDGANFADRVQALLWEGAGAGVQYFGFEGLWIGDIFRGEQVSWLGECDTAGGPARLSRRYGGGRAALPDHPPLAGAGQEAAVQDYGSGRIRRSYGTVHGPRYYPDGAAAAL